jgi:hypothetical protein
MNYVVGKLLTQVVTLPDADDAVHLKLDRLGGHVLQHKLHLIKTRLKGLSSEN